MAPQPKDRLKLLAQKANGYLRGNTRNLGNAPRIGPVACVLSKAGASPASWDLAPVPFWRRNAIPVRSVREAEAATPAVRRYSGLKRALPNRLTSHFGCDAA